MIAAVSVPFGVVVAAFIVTGTGFVFLYTYLLAPTVAMAMTRRFVRKARDGKVKVNRSVEEKLGGDLYSRIVQSTWSVTPNTGLNRMLLSNARKHGMIKIGLHGRIRYYGVGA